MSIEIPLQVLEAKLYEGFDQFASVAGVTGIRTEEAGIFQSATGQAEVAMAGAETPQNQSGVMISGTTSAAARSDASAGPASFGEASAASTSGSGLSLGPAATPQGALGNLVDLDADISLDPILTDAPLSALLS